MTDDGSQPPTEQLAPARAWCFWPLLVLLGGVVTLFVFSALSLLSTVHVWCVLGARHPKHKEKNNRWRISIQSKRCLHFRPELRRSLGLSHTAAAKIGKVVDYGPQAPINPTRHSSTAQTGVSHTHDVACWCLRAAAL